MTFKLLQMSLNYGADTSAPPNWRKWKNEINFVIYLFIWFNNLMISILDKVL